MYFGTEEADDNDFDYIGAKGRTGLVYFITPDVAINSMLEVGIQSNDYDHDDDTILVYGLLAGIKLFL